MPGVYAQRRLEPDENLLRLITQPLGFVTDDVVRCTLESRALYRLLNSGPCGGRPGGDQSPSVFFEAGEYGYAGVTTFLWDRTCQLFVFILCDVSMSHPWVHI